MDIVNFTGISSGLNPLDLIKLLNTFFNNFDKICDKYKIDKVILLFLYLNYNFFF